MRSMLAVLVVILVLSACSAHVSGALPPLGAPVLVSGTTDIQVDSFPFDRDDRVSFEEQVRLLSWASELYAELPSREFVASNSELEKWAATLLPLFVEAGSVAEAQVPTIMFGDLASKNTVGEVLGLPWAQCQPLLADYCQALGFDPTASGFVRHLKQWLKEEGEATDRAYPEHG